ncbi:MAG: phosphotransferase family protein [Halobacteriales archaeon]
MVPPGPEDAADPPGDEPDDRALLEATADAALPDGMAAEVEPLAGEGRSVVGAVTAADGERFVLKCAPDADAARVLRREAAVTAAVDRRTEVPVAGVVAAAFEPAGAPAPYVLFRWVEGRTLSEAVSAGPGGVTPALFGALGETLAALHVDTEHEAPGSVVPTGPRDYAVDPAPSWPELFAGELADHVEALAGTRFAALAEACWDELAGRLPALDTSDPPVLLHGDVGAGNVVYDGTDVAGLLDWERAFVGHPEYDLCRAEVRYFWSQWGRRDALASTLYAGYRSRRELADDFDARRPVYLATFYLMSLSTFESWAPRYADDLDAFAADVADKVRGVMAADGADPFG